MQEKYRALRIIILLYNIAAGIVFVGGLILAVLAVMDSTISYNFATNKFNNVPPNFGPGLGIFVTTLILVVSMIAVGQLIQVFLDIEYNTRQQARGIAVLVRRGTPRSTELPTKSAMRNLIGANSPLEAKDEFPNL